MWPIEGLRQRSVKRVRASWQTPMWVRSVVLCWCEDRRCREPLLKFSSPADVQDIKRSGVSRVICTYAHAVLWLLDPDQIRYCRVQYLQYERSGPANPLKRPPAHAEMSKNIDDTQREKNWTSAYSHHSPHKNAFSVEKKKIVLQCGVPLCIILLKPSRKKGDIRYMSTTTGSATSHTHFNLPLSSWE